MKSGNKRRVSMSAEKQAAEKEGQERLMAFAVGIGRCCNELGVEYGQLAKAANLSEEMLAPALAELVVKAAQQAEGA
jgi:hypothetical protein